MKKWKLVLTAVLASAAAIACGTAIGCKKGHSHTYAKEWSANTVEHWRESTCGHEKGSVGGHTFNDNYHCTTCEYDLELTGIKVTKTKTEYDLVNRLTRPVSVDDVKVTGITADNTEIALKESAYELEYYKGDVQLDSLSAADGGAYNIWATAEIGNEVYDSFVVVYVVESVQDFERVDEDNWKKTQELGLDEMLDTWKFKVTYSSGRTKDVYLKDNVAENHYKDKNVEIGNYSTFMAASGEKATITYTETDCMGTTVTKTQSVTYNVTNSGNSNVTFHKYSYDGIKATLTDATKDNQVLSESNFVSVTVGDNSYDNSFLTLLSGGIAQYRNNNSNQCLEIKGDTLSVTFEGVGMLVIGCRSTGGTNYSSIALKGEDGEYVVADYPGNSTTIGKDDNDNIYSVTTSSTLTFYIEKPGTYTICTLVEVQTAGDFIDTNRYTRIESLNLTDIRTNNDAEVVG